MNFKSLHDIEGLGAHAKKQIVRELNRVPVKPLVELPKQPHTPIIQSVSSIKSKKTRPARVMRTHDELKYCPWPSTDPFVQVYRKLENKYGRYENGGLLVTEMIIDGGAKKWRFDFALLSTAKKMHLQDQASGQARDVLVGNVNLLIEADGFGFHRSKDAFKNDRAKQTHALKEGFVLQRITNEDARSRLDEIMDDIDAIISRQCIYHHHYHITPKGKTQFVFRWGER
jgi:very-short-patch-repair endonuclease